MCSFYHRPKQEPKVWTTLGWWGKGARSGEDLSFVASVRLRQEVSNKRWRSAMSPDFILADSPISLIIMNQWKENLLRWKPFIYAVQSLTLLSGEQGREPLQPPILYDFLAKNEFFSVKTLCLHTSYFSCLSFECLRRCRAGEYMLHHTEVVFKPTAIPYKYNSAWDSSSGDQRRWSRAHS